jgi:hypothetical protein
MSAQSLARLIVCMTGTIDGDMMHQKVHKPIACPYLTFAEAAGVAGILQ